MPDVAARRVPPIAERLAHPSFPQPEDPDALVWRYMDLAKFIVLLDGHRLHLTRLDRMYDPYEGAPTRAIEDDPDAPPLEELRDILHRARRATYINAWYLGEHESEAMWRLYCRGGQGVALQTRYARLVETAAAHPDFYVGQVRYIDYDTERFPEADLFSPLMHKRIAFAHEREVRLVAVLPAALDSANPPGPAGIDIEWDPEAMVECVFIDPYADGYFAKAVEAVVEHLAPRLAEHVVWSRMRVAPLL